MRNPQVIDYVEEEDRAEHVHMARNQTIQGGTSIPPPPAIFPAPNQSPEEDFTAPVPREKKKESRAGNIILGKGTARN